MLIFYIINFFIVLNLFFIKCKNKILKNMGKYNILFIFFIIAGLNYKIHNDFFAYETIYPIINFENFRNINMESGYVFLNLIFNKWINFYQFKIIIYLFNTFFIYKGIKKILPSDKCFITIAFLYLYMPFYNTYLSAFRQSLAISLFIYSLEYLKDRKTYKFIFINLIGFAFHKSSIVLFLFYILYPFIKINLKYMYFYFSLISISFFLPIFNIFMIIPLKIISMITPKLGHIYFSLTFNRISLKMFFLYLMSFLLFMFLYQNNKFKNTKNNNFIIKGYFIYLLCISLSQTVPIFYRITPYVSIFYIFIIILICENLNNIMIKKIVKICFLLIFIFYYNLKYIYNFYLEDKRYIPFHFYFEILYKDIPYKETSEYNHLITNNKNKDLEHIKKEIIENSKVVH